MKCGIVYDPIFKKHRTGTGHPENPERASFIFQSLKERNILSATEQIPVKKCKSVFSFIAYTKNK